MSAAEEVLQPEKVSVAPRTPVLNRFLDLLSSVRFGIVVLCALVVLSMVGMLIMQQEVNEFDAYYASLTPAEKLVGGALGIFDIYHTWYYNLLLLVLSLNIVLASIDRFPSAWTYISKPKIFATRAWLLARRKTFTMTAEAGEADSISNAIAGVFGNLGLSTVVSEKNGASFVFGQRGKWNRIGAYIVHAFLLVLFLGHFVALQTGRNADVRMVPGESTNQIQDIQINLDTRSRFNVQIPFTIECLDIEQKLIDPAGGIDVSNTLDWRTQVRIHDPEYGSNVYDISLNKPLSYRGYRFFQSQTVPFGSARRVKLELVPENGTQLQTVEISRDGTTSLDNGTTVTFTQFLPDFTIGSNGKPDSKSGDYNNPAAVLVVQPPGGTTTQVIAFTEEFARRAPVAGAPKAGYKWRLVDFERSPYAHILQIKYDPYEASFIAWYIGGFGLIGALGFVFFVSHRRVWARIERTVDGTHDIIIAGEANRNQVGFDDKFDRIVESLKAKED